jgi:hypothetical protein
MRISSKILFVVGFVMVVIGAFDSLFNGPDVVGMFMLMAGFMSLAIDDV